MGQVIINTQKCEKILAWLIRLREKSEWLIRCELFAPNAPEQNPVEDIWLPGKNFLIEHWYLCQSFPLIKKLFRLVTHCQIFDLSKLNMYGFFAKKPKLIPT